MTKVNVYITLKPGLLDAQGKVMQQALENLGFESLNNVRIGKFIELELDDCTDINEKVDDMCKKLFANPNTENYRFEILDK